MPDGERQSGREPMLRDSSCVPRRAPPAARERPFRSDADDRSRLLVAASRRLSYACATNHGAMPWPPASAWSRF